MTEFLEILESRVPKGSEGSHPDALDHQEKVAVWETLDLQDLLDQTENEGRLDSQDPQESASNAKETWVSRDLQESLE